MTLQERADDSKGVMDALINDDIANTTVPLVRQWLKDWASFVKSGGDRPPVKPPTP